MPDGGKSKSLEARGAILAVTAGAATIAATLVVSALIQGQTRLAVTPSPPPSAANAGGADTSPTQLVRGHSLFTQECVSCHGGRAQGGIGPDLRRLDISDAQMAATIKAGAPPEMPAYGGKYQSADIDAITHYVLSLKK